MKKGILILLAMFMMVSTVEAKNGNYLPNSNRIIYNYNNAVNFIERGVEFFIFSNGDFDFDTRLNNPFYTRNGIRIENNNLRVFRDFRGRINRIGTISIRYDFRGNVSRIGSIYMNYHRNRLTNVGNLFVNYDHWGNPIFTGTVRDHFYNYNGVRFNVNVGRICNFNDAFFYRPDFRRNYTQFREDSRFFYYRANRKMANSFRGEILRRRKPATLNNRNTRNNNVTRNSNNSYRRNNSNTRRSLENTSTRRNREVETRKNTSNTRRISTNDIRNNNGKNIKRKVKTTKNSRNINTRKNVERLNNRTSRVSKDNRNTGDTKNRRRN